MKDDKLRATIQQRIARCREEMNLSQTELGKLVGKCKTAVASWEQGDSLPSADLLYNLSKIFNKTINYMYGEDEEQ